MWDCSVFLLVRLYRNNGFVAVNFMVNILVCYSWIGSFDVGIWMVASVLQGRFCVIIGYRGKLFGCFDVNLGNTGRMELFSMPGQSDRVKSFIFGRGRTQIPWWACLFDSHYWDTCGSPVIECLCFFVVSFFSSATKWKNCAIVPSGHWALNTMTTNCDPMRVKVFTCWSRVILMMIDVVMHGQDRVTWRTPRFLLKTFFCQPFCTMAQEAHRLVQFYFSQSSFIFSRPVLFFHSPVLLFHSPVLFFHSPVLILI